MTTKPKYPEGHILENFYLKDLHKILKDNKISFYYDSDNNKKYYCDANKVKCIEVIRKHLPNYNISNLCFINPRDSAPMRSKLQPKLNQLPKVAKQHPTLTKYYATADGQVINSTSNTPLNGTKLSSGLAFNPFLNNVKHRFKYFDSFVYESFNNIIIR